MNEADIIASLYFDTMDIYAHQKQNNGYGITINEEVLVASNVQCSLDKGGALQTEGAIANVGFIATSYTVFCRPNIDIQPGYKLVITYNGRTDTFIAGNPFPYQSHLEIPVALEERI